MDKVQSTAAGGLPMGKGRGRMFGAAVFTYGMLTSFVLSGASRNQRLARPNPPVMNYLGHLLFGMSASASALLGGYAAWTAVTG